MSFKDTLTRCFHSIMCRPGQVPQPDWGCCGCGAAEMDAYITVGCSTCGAPGEGYCWACLADLPWRRPDEPNMLTLADFTVLPGRERSA